MITFKNTHYHEKEIIKVENLYMSAFPKNERRPLKALLTDKTGSSEVLSIYKDDDFIGFVILLTHLNITHIIYFAIEERFQDMGLGSSVLNSLFEYKKNNIFLVDIEIDDQNAVNNPQRIKRKKFYLKNGFKETGIKYNWHHQEFEILVYGIMVTEKEIKNFWKEIYLKNNRFIGY